MSPTAVFDTVVLLQAAANPDGPSGACFRRVTDGQLTLVMSDEGADGAALRQLCPELAIVGPVALLAILAAGANP